MKYTLPGQEEDRIKIQLYLEFQRKYFEERTDGKTKVIHLNAEEKKDYFHRQRLYVEKEYQKRSAEAIKKAETEK